MSSSTALPSAKPRILRPWQMAVVVVLLLVVLAAVYASTRSKAEVQVMHPEYQDLENTVSTTGTVVPLHDFPARANFTGLVEAIYVHLGQKVRAGQMLMRMKDQYAVPRLEKARADLDDALVNEQNVLHNGSQEDRITSQAELLKLQTERNQAAAALDAMQQIRKNGSVSGAEIDAAKERLNTADTNLAALQKRLTNRYSPQDIQSWKDKVAADKASVEAEKVSWANANISTPIAGTVYVLPTHLYDFVPAGTDLLHVADLSKVQVRANFEEPDMGKLHVGQAVSVTWDGAPGRTWHGHLQAKPLGVTRTGTRNVGECTITLDDDKGDLPLDTNVAVVVVADKRSHVLAIPREALHSENGAHFVYRVVDGELKRTPVDTALASAMSIEITRGLKPEDGVVLHAIDDQKLSDGLRVTIRE
jgi:HlyD family secretion protein